MVLIENKDKKNEAINVNFDKLRRVGSLSGWQKILYNFIVNRLGDTLLQRTFDQIVNRQEKIVPEETDPELVKDVIKLAFIDYVDSVM